MGTMYNKIFTKILDSSIWLEPDATRIVWLTCIAAMDETGFCQFASPANLAHRANVTLSACMVALETLEGPDKNSSDPENGGRRLERVPGGWMVLNAEKYRNIVTRAASQEANRKRVARYRQSRTCNGHVRKANGPVMQSEAYTETEAVSDTEKEPEQTRAREPEPPRYDITFAAFRDAYPAARRKGGVLAQQDYVMQARLAGGPDALLAALENHKRSAQWRAGKVPGMDVWLREERWRQSLPDTEDQPQNKTISAAENLLRKLRSGEPVALSLPKVGL